MLWQDKPYAPKWLIIAKSLWNDKSISLLDIRIFWGENYGFKINLLNFHFSLHYFPKGRSEEW